MNQSEAGNQENLAKLGKKIADFSKHLGAIKEDARNDHSKFNYISSNKMLALMREKLIDFNLAIIPEVIGHKEDHFANQKGTNIIRTTVDMNFHIIDLETGFSFKFMFAGADQDSGGKSFAQAVTEATKRCYFKLFHVSSKEDIDPDSKTTVNTGSTKPAKQQPKGEWTLKLEELEEMEKKGIISKESVNSYRKPYSEKDVAECARIYNAIMESKK